MVHLLHLTLNGPTAISHACYGAFSAAGTHEFVVARGRHVELLRPDADGRVHVVARCDAFALVRNLSTLRLGGQSRDFVVVTSDSGRLAILRVERNAFHRVASETYGKTGCRRTVPGQYVAVDPAGRAVMIAAVEKDKLVFVTNRDAADQIVVSSPLEANKSRSVTYAIAALDVEYENPLFASLEAIYPSEEDILASSSSITTTTTTTSTTPAEAIANAKELAFYELDLGLNKVVRKWTTPVDASANALVAVSGGGVLVCSEGALTYYKPGVDAKSVLAAGPLSLT